jgi:NAD(P)-dependent dehydrogenase (short-subunit alcohol dehydrogenase family)
MKRVVLITGASGGIGQATAQLFTKNDWFVFGSDIQAPSGASDIAQFIQTDISQPSSWEQIVGIVNNQGGRLDALVNNAAVQLCKPLLDTSVDEWDAVMSTNVRSVFLGSRYTYPLLHRSSGAIVNISSVHAVATSISIAAYAASKGAIMSLTRAMALEFGPGIRVNAVLPGAVSTPMLQSGLSRGHLSGDNVCKSLQELGKRHVAGRVGQPDEIAQVIYFLADNKQSTFMTGQTIIVDGGATARLSTE